MIEESTIFPMTNVSELLAKLIAEGYPGDDGAIDIRNVAWFDEPDGSSLFDSPPSVYMVIGYASESTDQIPRRSLSRLLLKVAAKDLFDSLRWVSPTTPVHAIIDKDDDLIFYRLQSLSGIVSKVLEPDTVVYKGNLNE